LTFLSWVAKWDTRVAKVAPMRAGKFWGALNKRCGGSASGSSASRSSTVTVSYPVRSREWNYALRPQT